MKELSKEDKRTCRELIHVALERECKAFAERINKINQGPVASEEYHEESGVSVEGPWHKRFIELYNATDLFNERLRDRYDGISGSRYISTICILHEEGWLKDEEITRIKSIDIL